MTLVDDYKNIQRYIKESARTILNSETPEFKKQFEQNKLQRELLQSRKKAKVNFNKFELSGDTLKALEKYREGREVIEIQVEASKFAYQRRKKIQQRFKSFLERKRFDELDKADQERLEETLKEESQFRKKDSTELPNWVFFLEPILKYYLSSDLEDSTLVDVVKEFKKAFSMPEDIQFKKKCVSRLPDSGKAFYDEVQRLLGQNDLFALQKSLGELDALIDHFEDTIIPNLIDVYLRNSPVELSKIYTSNLKEIKEGGSDTALEIIKRYAGSSTENFKNLRNLPLVDLQRLALERVKLHIREDAFKKASIFDEKWNKAKMWLRSQKTVSSEKQERIEIPQEIADTLNEIQRKLPNDRDFRLLNNLDILFRYREIYKFPMRADGSYTVPIYLTVAESQKLATLRGAGTFLNVNENSQNYRSALIQRSLLVQKINTEKVYLKTAKDNAVARERNYRAGRNKATVLLRSSLQKLFETLRGDTRVRFNVYLAYRAIESTNDLLENDLEFLLQKFSPEGVAIYSKLQALKGKQKQALEKELGHQNLSDPDLSFETLKLLELKLKV